MSASKRLSVVAGAKALVAAALPGADVKGLDNEAAAPSRIPANGLAIVREGNPGEPDVDLSPLTYHWEHRIPVELAAYSSGTKTPAEALDDMLKALGAAVAADRTLGGLCDWLDVLEPEIDDIAETGTRRAKGAELVLIASYSTTTPLN